jgi:hypothetical protein
MKEEIKQELNEAGSSLAGKQIPMPYALPDGYFSRFEKNLRSEITEDDTTAAVHALAGKTLPYHVPGNYFDKLPKQLLEKNEAGKQKGIRITFPQLRWAAAAIVLIAVSVGTYNLYMPSADTIKPGKVMLASVNNNDIQEYLANAAGTNVKLNNDDGYPEIIEIDTKDIISYLDQTGWDTEYY